MRHLAACLLLLAACGEQKPPGAPDFGDLLNDYRRAAGVGAVSRDEVLGRAAVAHAAEMERLGYYGHFSPVPGRRTPDDRLALEGWPGGRRYDELLVFADTPEGALASWRSKPSYDEVLRDPELALVGVARGGRVWVLLLGATAGKHGGVTDR